MKPKTIQFLKERLQGSKRTQIAYMGIGLCWLIYGLIQMSAAVAKHRSLSDSIPLLWSVVAMIFVIQAYNESTFQNLCEAALAGCDDATGTSSKNPAADAAGS